MIQILLQFIFKFPSRYKSWSNVDLGQVQILTANTTCIHFHGFTGAGPSSDLLPMARSSYKYKQTKSTNNAYFYSRSMHIRLLGIIDLVNH